MANSCCAGHYAAFFAAAGFSVVCFDLRALGASEGMPRLEVDPERQIADWRNVLTFAESLSEIDAVSGLGLWGSSFAGGLAMVIAANDERVRCIVAQIPNVSGHRNSRAPIGLDHIRPNNPWPPLRQVA